MHRQFEVILRRGFPCLIKSADAAWECLAIGKLRLYCFECPILHWTETEKYFECKVWRAKWRDLHTNSGHANSCNYTASGKVFPPSRDLRKRFRAFQANSQHKQKASDSNTRIGFFRWNLIAVLVRFFIGFQKVGDLQMNRVEISPHSDSMQRSTPFQLCLHYRRTTIEIAKRLKNCFRREKVSRELNWDRRCKRKRKIENCRRNFNT